jgi:hypothetical protein
MNINWTELATAVLFLAMVVAGTYLICSGGNTMFHGLGTVLAGVIIGLFGVKVGSTLRN